MKISYRQIQHALSECRFHPDESGPLKIIVDVDNAQFYELRALECIKEAQEIAKTNFYEKGVMSNINSYNDYIIKAIRLLILAKEYRNGG